AAFDGLSFLLRFRDRPDREEAPAGFRIAPREDFRSIRADLRRDGSSVQTLPELSFREAGRAELFLELDCSRRHFRAEPVVEIAGRAPEDRAKSRPEISSPPGGHPLPELLQRALP